MQHLLRACSGCVSCMKASHTLTFDEDPGSYKDLMAIPNWLRGHEPSSSTRKISQASRDIVIDAVVAREDDSAASHTKMG